MRILFDQGTPVPLGRRLVGHSVSTAFEMGWSTLKNGDLLDAAEQAGFELRITTDQSLPHQQNLQGLQLSILILPTTSWRIHERHAGTVAQAVAGMSPGMCTRLAFPAPP